MLIGLLVATLVLLAAGIALPTVWTAPPAFWAHLVLAAGVMGLIVAAMQHFIPVLTRGRGAGRVLARLPLVAAAAGLAAAASFAGVMPYRALPVAAALALVAVAAMLAWTRRRDRECLGPAHPGLYWYIAALACLALGLTAALILPFAPQWHGPLRAFHLHVNLYGFIGLTAVGTLQVLMPTVANLPDPGVNRRLRRDLKWAVGGTLALALGKAGIPGLAWLGLALWGWTLLALVSAWWRLYRPVILRLHGGSAVLMAALVGYAVALLGTIDGLGEVPGPLTIFLPGFLLALVSGAAGHLAPVWLRPGGSAAMHVAGQRALGRYAGVRALLFLAAALLPLFGFRCAGMPALFALGWFLVLFVAWLYRD